MRILLRQTTQEGSRFMPDNTIAAASVPGEAMSTQGQQLLHLVTDLWWESETYTAPLGPAYTANEQGHNEASLAHFQEDMIAEMQHPPRTRDEVAALQQRVSVAAAAVATLVLGLEERHLQVVTANGFPQAVIDFAREARRFDPTVSAADVFQASRNAWTMYGMQLLLDLPVHLTPAIFAYSMLYPYSDNYLDDPVSSEQAKLAFSERLHWRLRGEKMPPANKHEEKVFALLAMIEEQSDPQRYPQVQASLLAIHAAQDKSIRLLRRNVSPYEVDVLGITFEKGGASVLADGYLVAGTLTPAQVEFMFGWGALMQLLDDLQDVEADSQAGLMTVFAKSKPRSGWEALLGRLSHASAGWPLDAITNRTLHFAYRVMERLDCFTTPDSEPFKELMRRAVVLSMLGAIGNARALYTPAYVREMERHLPVRFSFLGKHSPFARRQRSLMSMIETFAQSGASSALGI